MYVDTVHVEFLHKEGLYILYVPDEAASDKDKVLELVDQAMKEAQVSQVDIAIMHGAFTYQIPIKSNQFHDEHEYLKRVKGLIHIGHIHTRSSYQRIIAQGSFDRLSHNEEEAKGAVIAQYKDGDYTWDFVDNKKAKIYKSIRIKKDMTLSEVFEYLDKKINKYPHWSFIRIVAPMSHTAIKHWKDIVSRYKLYRMSKKTLEEEKEENASAIDQLIQNDSEYIAIQITPDNIIKLCLDELSKRVPDFDMHKYQDDLESIYELV